MYKAIFFDLDDTLWDFMANAKNSMKILYNTEFIKLKPNKNFEEFYTIYDKINDIQWNKLSNKEINLNQVFINRFKHTLNEVGIIIEDDEILLNYNEIFHKYLNEQNQLIEGSIEILETLYKNYTLGIITNGKEEEQVNKLKNTGLTKYFKHIITSDRAGVYKPDSKIFELALKESGFQKEEVLFIGDSYLSDIKGAKSYGIDVIWFKRKNVQEIHDKTIYKINEVYNYI